MIKSQWISIFRKIGDSILIDLGKTKQTRNNKASEINKRIKEYRDQEIKCIKDIAKKNMWDNQTLLNEILLLTYASYIVMLEYRNKVWEYEYMSFARRIGELWEPFCKLAFDFPVKELSLIASPNFDKVQTRIKSGATDYIDSLDLDDEIKEELKRQYDIPWSMVDSGGIKLGLDLHFEQGGIHYNCDFKSGFSSNEKGNTNRLLLVASIYNFLGEIEKTILFVRQSEDENNHYLQTLKNSPYWDVYCADDGYAAMKTFTGFDMRKWLDDNVDWPNDISEEFKQHLQKNDLLKYLTW
ncbi:hypothetical protein C0033_02490 [Clostridium sp. chh4-2]|uniref:hypothetical protein n=1 Tax=Clostridium sp. chh4-2 TaxID=2067550 RepID=UPI000CCF72FF|nr:hypothetical protein [Clostridium sp. chh4-2]PNV63550.1 hypothetical protein C0033_02490 [Clostridium sp. chh4-2]